MTSTPRPRLVTIAGSMVIAGSVLLVLNTFEQISGLRTLETREAVERLLADPPADGLGLSVSEVLDVMRVLAMIGAACAAAAAILGGYALRRSKSARIGLTVLAVPLVLTGVTLGGFLATLVAVSIAMLWLQPARDWYDGITRPEPVRRPEPPAPVAPTPPSTSVAPPSEPRAYPGFGGPQYPTGPQQHPQQHPQPHPQPYAPQQPYGRPAPYAPGPPAGPRPAAVVWACALTWALSGLVAVGMVLSAVVVAVSPDVFLDQLRRQDAQLAEDVTEDLLIGTIIGMAVVLVVWCTAAAVVALFAFRRAGWARVTLLVSAAVAGAGCLLGTALGSFPLLVPMIGCAVTVSMLNRREVRAWFAARGSI